MEEITRGGDQLPSPCRAAPRRGRWRSLARCCAPCACGMMCSGCAGRLGGAQSVESVEANAAGALGIAAGPEPAVGCGRGGGLRCRARRASRPCPRAICCAFRAGGVVAPRAAGARGQASTPRCMHRAGSRSVRVSLRCGAGLADARAPDISASDAGQRTRCSAGGPRDRSPGPPPFLCSLASRSRSGTRHATRRLPVGSFSWVRRTRAAKHAGPLTRPVDTV